MRRILAVLVIAAAVAGGLVPGQASAATPIRPGAELVTRLDATTVASCTADFVFTASDVTYLGMAAHCAGRVDATSGSGCRDRSLPLGTPVRVDGQAMARLAYSSWTAMQRRGERDPDLCTGNDFALIALAPADAARVDPSVPVLGGPVGLVDAVTPGRPVASYQPRDAARAVKSGRLLAVGEWVHTVLTDPPGIPGDSGAGFLDASGRAFGVLSTEYGGTPHTNGVVRLAAALDYASRWGGLGPIALVPGRRPFRV